MIYTRNGKLKYDEDLLDIIAIGENLTTTQHDRTAGDGKYKFKNCDFRNQDFRGVSFDGLVMDGCDFTGSDLRGATFYKVGLRSAIFKRCQLDGATFINCNLREGYMTECWAKELTLQDCNFIGADLQHLIAPDSTFIANDFRKVNARKSDFQGSFFDKNRMRGMITRNTSFHWTNTPRFFHDAALQYDFMEPNEWVIGYKLTAADGRGIYHPKITYEVGKTFNAENQDGKHVPLHPKHNTGMAVASMDWVLKEWVSCGAYGDYKLFQAKFQVKDIIENEGSDKFNVRKMKIVKEIDMKQFYDEMTESINYDD